MVSIFTSFSGSRYWTPYSPYIQSNSSHPTFESKLRTGLSKVFKIYQINSLRLIQLNSNGSPKKFTNLYWKSFLPFKEVHQEVERFGFKLGKKEFYAESESELEKWMQNLNQRCILDHFEEDFVFISKIGKGSTAKVYLAEHLVSKQQFAVKRISKKQLFQHENGPKNLADEIRILHEIQHENIVKLYSVYESKKTVFLVMEYLPFGNLYQRVLVRGKFSDEISVKFMRNLLLTLEYLHSKSIVHRDLKLENIIMTGEEDFEFKIIDFGLAYLSSATQSSKCGSPGYVAPEILFNIRYDSKIDIFSAGVILYILISGKHPFHARTTRKILQRNIKCEFSLHKNVSKGAAELINYMMEADPELRPSASQLLEHPWINVGKNCNIGSWNTGQSEIGVIGHHHPVLHFFSSNNC